MFYGSNVWDPGLIIAQIITVQCLFYVSLGLIQAVTLGPILGHITVAYIFDWATLHWSTPLGWLNWVSHVANAVAGAAVLAWIVERAKKCLDFGATCYIWHTIFVWWYSGWPSSWAWWTANGAGMLTMVLLGEWLCVRREMQDIPLSIPQRLSSGLLSRRKESGAVGIPMMPLATEDPDLPPRPRLRTGFGSTSTLQRSAAAAAAAAAGSSTSFSSSSGTAAAAAAAVAPSPAATPVPLVSPVGTAPPRPGGAVQMAALIATPPRGEGGAAAGGAAGASAGVSSSSQPRKKLLARPSSAHNLRVLVDGGGGRDGLAPAKCAGGGAGSSSSSRHLSQGGASGQVAATGGVPGAAPAAAALTEVEPV